MIAKNSHKSNDEIQHDEVFLYHFEKWLTRAVLCSLTKDMLISSYHIKIWGNPLFYGF